jgi:tetratricopeptide (TPR) repeat protein
MDVIYSGQSATMALIQGADVQVVRAGRPDLVLTIAREGVSYLFQTSRDLVVSRDARPEEVSEQFATACNADRALRLLLIALDPEEETDLREEAADCANELIENRNVTTFLENEFYSKPMPAESDIRFFADSDKRYRASVLISNILRRQAAIERHRRAWDQLPELLFRDGKKAAFEEQAIKKGAFRLLACLDPTKEDPNTAILGVLRTLSPLPNSRAVVTEWTKDFKRKGAHAINLSEEVEDETASDHVSVRGHAPYMSAIGQQEVIVQLLKAGRVNVARKYADELVATQMKSGGPEYAAMSLCSLAQEAKYFGLHSLQLEWALRATDVYPEDGWARGQAADALMQFYRLDEALVSLKLSETFGHSQFAATGRARVLRLQGRLDEALIAFRRAYDDFPADKGATFALAGSAETLRDMWRFVESLAEYERAIAKFPSYAPFLCGRASVLAEMGRLEEAFAAYDLPSLRENLVALNGKSSVLKQLGRLHEALDVLSYVIEAYPTDPVARCSQADTLRLLEDYEGALQVYSNVKAMHPNISVGYSGYAEVLRDMRNFADAIQLYQEAAERFPFDAHVCNGYANIMKVSDELSESLRLYDANVRQFPYDLISKSGRADLLKRLGRYDEALEAYDQIIQVWPDYLAARHGKAAVLVVRGRVSEAEQLLPAAFPSTRDEWIAWQIRGMILLARDDLDAAVQHFQSGLDRTPFAREKRYFARGLCAARLRKGEFQGAVGAVENLGGGLSNILRFHALAGMGRLDQARASFRELTTKCPQQLIDLKDAVAGRFGFAFSAAHHNDNWIFGREAEALLQEAA